MTHMACFYSKIVAGMLESVAKLSNIFGGSKA